MAGFCLMERTPFDGTVRWGLANTQNRFFVLAMSRGPSSGGQGPLKWRGGLRIFTCLKMQERKGRRRHRHGQGQRQRQRQRQRAKTEGKDKGQRQRAKTKGKDKGKDKDTDTEADTDTDTGTGRDKDKDTETATAAATATATDTDTDTDEDTDEDEDTDNDKDKDKDTDTDKNKNKDTDKDRRKRKEEKRRKRREEKSSKEEQNRKKNREANRSKEDRYNSHLTALTPTQKKAQLAQRKKAKRKTNYERHPPAKNKKKKWSRELKRRCDRSKRRKTASIHLASYVPGTAWKRGCGWQSSRKKIPTSRLTAPQRRLMEISQLLRIRLFEIGHLTKRPPPRAHHSVFKKTCVVGLCGWSLGRTTLRSPGKSAAMTIRRRKTSSSNTRLSRRMSETGSRMTTTAR